MLGYENQLELKEKAFNGEIVSPNLYLAGPSFNGNSINSPEQAIQKVHGQMAAAPLAWIRREDWQARISEK